MNQVIQNNLDQPMGFLKVEAYTADRAVPVANAQVEIYERLNGTSKLIKRLVTDRDGVTPVVALRTVSRNLSMEPGNQHPFTTYDVRVQHPDYYMKVYQNVPVFENNVAIQNAEMIPIPIDERRGKIEYVIEHEPEDL